MVWGYDGEGIWGIVFGVSGMEMMGGEVVIGFGIYEFEKRD